MRLLSWFCVKHKYPRQVLLHTPTGDMIAKVSRKGIVEVPWIASTCPFHLEDDGTVTLRLMWSEGPSKGYGKTWDGITWENVK
jgi:hypothetical protein